MGAKNDVMFISFVFRLTTVFLPLHHTQAPALKTSLHPHLLMIIHQRPLYRLCPLRLQPIILFPLLPRHLLTLGPVRLNHLVTHYLLHPLPKVEAFLQQNSNLPLPWSHKRKADFLTTISTTTT